jgi:hypothetical protein
MEQGAAESRSQKNQGTQPFPKQPSLDPLPVSSGNRCTWGLQRQTACINGRITSGAPPSAQPGRGRGALVRVCLPAQDCILLLGNHATLSPQTLGITKVTLVAQPEAHDCPVLQGTFSNKLYPGWDAGQ